MLTLATSQSFGKLGSLRTLATTCSDGGPAGRSDRQGMTREGLLLNRS